MRKILTTYLPASMLLAFLAMILFTCGGGGVSSNNEIQPAPPAPPPSGNLSIDGPSFISVYGIATYTATLSMSDGSTSMVTPSWSVNSSKVSISPGGELNCTGIDGDLTVTITATYSSGGITETDSMDVTVTNNTVEFGPGCPMMLHFEENIDADGGYHSYLYRFNADSSFEQFSYENPPDTSDLVTGSCSVDAEGKLILTLPGQGTITVTLLTEPWLVSHVLVDDGTGTPYNTTWEWTGPGPYPFDKSLIPGTYINQYGDTWIFNANGTGSTTGDGGWTYTWSVDNDGILKVVFPNGYVGSMYERPGSQVSATSYTIIEWAFLLNTPTGEFGFYYGGMNLTRQGGAPPPAATLTGLSINGPSSMSEYGTATYAATASWSDGSTTSVTPTWSVSPQVADINTEGKLYCLEQLTSDQTVIITATYSDGSIAQADSISVTITDVPTIPFTNEELSGKVFFQEDFLYILNADSSLELYTTLGPSYYTTGTWSNDPDGLFLDYRFADFGPITVERLSDSSTEMEVAIHEMVWGVMHHVYFRTWEKTVPVDPAMLPGTYAGSDGYTWVFNADGTGSIPDFPGGGLTFTWSVDSEGVLRMPSNTGYTASLYMRETTTAWGVYFDIKAAFTEHNTSTGSFYKYYGGIELTRQ